MPVTLRSTSTCPLLIAAALVGLLTTNADDAREGPWERISTWQAQTIPVSGQLRFLPLLGEAHPKAVLASSRERLRAGLHADRQVGFQFDVLPPACMLRRMALSVHFQGYRHRRLRR